MATLACACALASPRAAAQTAYGDGISDQNLPYWGSFFSSGLGTILPSLLPGAGARILPPGITYARYVAQWDETGPFVTWLEHVPPGLTVDLALTNYHAPEAFSEGSPNYPATPHAYYVALEAFLNAASVVLHRPVAVVEPWNEPNNQGGFRKVAQALYPAQFADEAQRLCAVRACTVVAGDVEDIYGEVGEYMRHYKAGLDFTPDAWGVHPYRAVNNYGSSATGMPEFEQQCGGCRPWFTEVGIFYCERTGARGIFEGPTWQSEHAEDLIDHVLPRYRPEHVFYYEFKAPETPAAHAQEGACLQGHPAGTDTALYTVYGEARPAASLIFGP